MTSRENYLNIYKNHKEAWVPADGPFDMIPMPGEHGDAINLGDISTDWFGTSWIITKAAGLDAGTPTPGVFAIEDITEYKEKGVIPTNEFVDSFDWEGYCKFFTKDWNREERISYCFAPAGFFERIHHLMPFENALCAFYEEPEILNEFLDDMLEFKKCMIRNVVKYAKPDVLIFFDDYGMSTNMFISEELWLEFIAPRLKAIIDYAHELGLIFEMHSCGYITPLVKHMVEMGIDSLQPLQAINDVKYVKETFGDKIVIHGGITASDLVGDTISKETMRERVKECVDICAPGGNFIVMLSECLERYDEVNNAFKECLNEAGWEYK